MREAIGLSLMLATLAFVLVGCPSAHTAAALRAGVDSSTSTTGGSVIADSAISAAHATDTTLFSIFPAHLGTRSCLIPRGGPQRTRPAAIAGTCSTRLRVGPGFSGRTIVSFTETWRGRGHKKARQVLRHAWQIIETVSLKPVATRSVGNKAPQFYD